MWRWASNECGKVLSRFIRITSTVPAVQPTRYFVLSVPATVTRGVPFDVAVTVTQDLETMAPDPTFYGTARINARYVGPRGAQSAQDNGDAVPPDLVFAGEGKTVVSFTLHGVGYVHINASSLDGTSPFGSVDDSMTLIESSYLSAGGAYAKYQLVVYAFGSAIYLPKWNASLYAWQVYSNQATYLLGNGNTGTITHYAYGEPASWETVPWLPLATTFDAPPQVSGFDHDRLSDIPATPLTVDWVADPASLGSPAAGHIAISLTPDATGYLPMKLSSDWYSTNRDVTIAFFFAHN